MRSQSVICCRSFWVWLCVFLLPSLAWAQEGGNKLRGWDANGDGLLQQNEIPAGARPALRKMAEQQGLDADRPLPIKKLLAAKQRKQQTRPGLDKPKSKDKSGKKAKKKDRKKDDRRGEKQGGKADDRAEVKRQATTEKNAARRVKGFGKSAENDSKKAGAAQAAESKPKTDAEKRAARREEWRKRHFGRLAKSIIAQHDRNRNGQLDRSEWDGLKSNAAKFDKNRDSVLDKAEVADYLAGYGADESKPVRRPKQRRTGASGRPKSYRFLTAHERLPDGLPDWFVERDVNYDGQISLREYASSISRTKLAQFQRFDTDGDGLATPEEILQGDQ